MTRNDVMGKPRTPNLWLYHQAIYVGKLTNGEMTAIPKTWCCTGLQSMAVFDKISGAEKAQIIGGCAENSCQVQITTEFIRGKSNEICVENNAN